MGGDAQLMAGKQRGGQLGRHWVALLIDKHRAIAVPVESDSEVGTRPLHRSSNVGQILDLQRIGFVIGKRTVGLEIKPLDYNAAFSLPCR